MKRALIYIEHEYIEDSVALIEVAKQIHGTEFCQTNALIINTDESALLGKFDVVTTVQNEAIKNYDSMTIADVVATQHQEHNFDSIIIAGTQQGRMLAPRVAMRLNTGLIADVMEIRRVGQKLEFLRPAYGGRMMACIEMRGDGPVMLTVKPGIFTYQETMPVKLPKKKETKVVKLQGLAHKSRGIRQLQKEKKAVQTDIRESDVLISGGGGISKHFKVLEALEALAQALHGQVSASRAMIDKGLAPRSIQVGQSGKTVRPSLYIALGIHGAIQHVVAMNEARYIISVNTNANAPICSISDIVVEGDAATFIDKLLKKINEDQKLTKYINEE